MEIHQLKTFIAVAREGSITRASERLYLSQPAVSAHIKAIEDTLGLTLFARTPRGMTLTPDGERLLARAEQTLQAHRELIEEATRIRGQLSGRLRIGGGTNSGTDAVGRLMMRLSERYPEVEMDLEHGHSLDVLDGVRSGRLDAGFYNEPADPPEDLKTIEVGGFAIYLAAPAGLLPVSDEPDWQAMAELPWIYPTVGASCCGHAAESLFRRYQFRPRKTIGIDREKVTRSLIAGGVGIGLLHADTAMQARQEGEVDVICQVRDEVRVMFAFLQSRARDPLLIAAANLLEAA